MRSGGDVDDMLKQFGNVAKKADVTSQSAEISAMKTTIIKWSVATLVALAASVFTIARFVH